MTNSLCMQVHESQIIGELGKGYKYAIEVLNIGRIGIGAQVSMHYKKKNHISSNNTASLRDSMGCF